MRRFFYGLILRIKHLFISIRQVRRIHLGDVVMYNGERFVVNNGTRVNNEGETLWDILPYNNFENGSRTTYYATSKELKKVKSLSNLKNDLLYHYRWYMCYWYGIDLREKLEKNKG